MDLEPIKTYIFYYIDIQSLRHNTIEIFDCLLWFELFSRHLIEQSEGRGSKLKEEIVNVREALGKVQLQKDVLDREKQEAGIH